ncbi:hypothetical protein A4X09_0g1249 [Tilletia walkeri]|uniref:LsmAD domain-containing protein n=1 Tax=Tilletia walkeri TaxID=117179 RepID=A0A8X7NDI1_9BASI|nr:hypothetical protein A4X09_0g1249 [Tilletia walkeri]
MAAPSFKSRGGGPIGAAGRGGRNGSTGGSSLGANSRWSSGPPRQLNPNTGAANNNANAKAPAAAAPSANDQQQQQQSQQQPQPQQQQQPTPNRANPPANTAASSQSPASAFPTLGGAQGENTQAKMHERIVFLLASLVGSMVVVTARGGAKYVGLLSAASTEQGELGISLSSVQQILTGTGANAESQLGPAKGAVIVLGRDLDEIEAYDVKVGEPIKDSRATAERDSFRTDTDISKTQFDALGGGRVLQKWSDDPGMDLAEAARAASMGLNGTPRNMNSLGGLEEAPGKSAAGGAGWDQFAVNERQFGVKSNYDEDIYTTKLDRSGKDFKERERNAERLAREMLTAVSNNPHLAEERNQATAGAAGADEEAKYGAVLRGPNAYVPPAARRAGGPGGLNAAPKPISPSISPNPPAAAKSTVTKPVAPATAGGAAAAAPPTASGSGGIKPPTVVLQASSKDHTPELAQRKIAPGDVSKEFSKFVSSERERMHAKRKEIQKEDMQNELLALKLWHGNFQLKTPIPENLDSPLRNKNKAEVSDKPRDPSLQKSLSPNATHADASRTNALAPLIATTAESNSPRLPPFNRNNATASSSSGLRGSRPPGPKIQIAQIPPFDPERFKSRQATSKTGGAAPASASVSAAAAAKPAATTAAPAPAAIPPPSTKAEAPSSTALSAKASSFKPFNPNATAFKPGAPAKKTDTPAPAATATGTGPATATATATAAAPPSTNPFFGNRILKRPASHAPLHVREEFNPFKVSKVPEAVSISPEWRFTGKNYRQLFTAVPPATQVPAPMAPHAEENFAMVQPQHSMPQPQPGMVPMAPGAGHPPHGPPPTMQPHHPGPQISHSGPPTHGGGPPQQIGMSFPGQPQFYPRFQQQPHFPQQMPMPAGQGIPYGAIPPQFVGQLPFSPSMPPHGGHPVYSPQMANMPPPGQHGQFVPQQAPMQGPMPGGPPHGPGGGPPRGGPPPHMQKGHPQMYFQQPGPGMVHAMPYGHAPHFIPGGPGGRPGMPPMDGSYPGVGVPQMGDPGNNHM